MRPTTFKVISKGIRAKEKSSVKQKWIIQGIVNKHIQIRSDVRHINERTELRDNPITSQGRNLKQELQGTSRKNKSQNSIHLTE